jgi:deoxyribodipyrimidine photo-lyase
MPDSNRILIWYRNDLRLHDHEPLSHALKHGATVIPVYCFDPRQFAKTPFGFAKTGAFRAQFLRESVADLRSQLQAIGSDLIIRQGKPEEILPALVDAFDIDAVHYHQEVTFEETNVEAQLQAMLKVPCRSYWGHTLYLPEDLPFAITALPELFTAFRKAVENEAGVNPAIAAPTQLNTPLKPLPEALDRGELPTLAALGIEPGIDTIDADNRGVLPFRGGETAGLVRLNDYFWQQDRLRVYKETRNGMLGANYSSKFSPWLALGCLSPRYIYDQIDTYETQRVRNDSTYWLIFELLWRDYFRFVCAKHGHKVFKLEGLRGVKIEWKQDWQRFELWRSGMTGFPLVDANMRELATTGFMSNRGRQNVASFLTKNLGIDWRMGAAYFESMLIDYDVCSNWGNWNYTAGVGNDARGFRFFNITKQAKDYDANGDYVKHWCPELTALPAGKVHEPWKLSGDEQKHFGLRLGVDYPRPVVDLFQSAASHEKIYNAAFGESIAKPQNAKSQNAKPQKRRSR